MGEHKDPLDNVSAYPGAAYTHQPVTPWGVDAPRKGQDRPAEQRAARELELATTDHDQRGVGRFGAGTTSLGLTAVSVLLLWGLGGLPGLFLAVVSGVLAVIFGLRARRSAHYVHNRAWWFGTAAVVLTVLSFVAVLTVNVLVPDKARFGTSCVVTGSCPTGTGP